MVQRQVYQVDSFTTERFKGNPAGVVYNADGLSELQMQALARELNNSETAFICSPQASDHEVWIRFFTPTTEVPSCGYATIAAHFVRATELTLASGTVFQKIGLGVLPVDVVREADNYKIVMTQGKIEFEEPFALGKRDEIVQALGLTLQDLDGRCPVQIVSTGHSKVLIGISARSTLHKLQPDLMRLKQLSNEICCNGYFVFTLDSESEEFLAHGRMFAPAIGIAEDPVTGNANGPLGAYLVKHRLVGPTDGAFVFKAKQGEAIGRPGVVEVIVDSINNEPAKVRVAGQAVIAFKTQIEL
jgi:PhzF family phenazine biosynthesis protein